MKIVPVKQYSLLLAVVLLILVHELLRSFHVGASIASARHAIFIVGLLIHHVLRCLLFCTVGALTKHDDLILSLCVLPAAKDQQVRTNGSRCVSETNSGRLAKVFALLPGHGVSGPDLEVITRFFSAFVLESCARCLCPASEHDDVGARDIHCVTEAVLRRSAADSESRPDERLCIEHSDIVQVAFLQCGSLFATASATHVFLIEPESSMNDQVGADKDGTVTLAWARSRTRCVRFVPSHHL